jgi:hypothetical protein
MRTVVALMLAATVGCAHKMADLKKPQREQVFTLAKDYTRTEVRGLGYKWVEGLRAGVYTLAAEDDDGLYFMGPGRCVVKLIDKYADEYLMKGDAKVDAGSWGGTVGFFTGGLWLPKDGVQKAPRLFYESQPDAPHAGAVIHAIIESGRGDVLFIPFESEKTFLSGLKVIDR